ncbi:transposase, partial [Bacillus thuringiensis]|nr:transposase [Bacillus thuringiensis]
KTLQQNLAVDTNGLIHAIDVTTANITDRKGAIKMCERHKKTFEKVTNILCDGGYTGSPFAQSIKRNDLNFTNLSCYQNDGLWNAPFLGWKITVDCERIVNEHLKIVDRVAYWQVWQFY